MNKYGNYTKYMFLTVHGLTQPDSGYYMIETGGYSRLGGKTKPLVGKIIKNLIKYFI